MKIATLMNYADDYHAIVDEVRDLERAGLDVLFVPEAYGFDAPTMMGYLAANTKTVQIASGILPIYSRTPTLLAMTAAGLDNLSGGRAMLGLGASGPQVIEGWHGVPYDAPVARMREIIAICRTVWRRERLDHQGTKYHMPLPRDQGRGLGKPLKMITTPMRPQIPIIVASLGDKSVEMTAELADGWLPAFFLPGVSEQPWKDALKRGQERRSSDLAPLEVYAGGLVAIGENVEHLRDSVRPVTALYVGGMGARSKNFYNELFASYGYEEEARRIQDLFLSGKKVEAEAAIPESFLRETTLVGPEGFVKERVAAFRDAGVTCLNIAAAGETPAERIRTVDRLRNIVEQA